jgi:putative nucleotidyltransferase with HDIG domain
MSHRDDDRPSPVSGETDTEVPIPEVPGVVMPASRRIIYRSIVSAPSEVLAGELDVDTVAALLDSHAQVGCVRLRVLFPDGRVFFEANPPDPVKGEENEVPIVLPGHELTVLRGAMEHRSLELVASVIQSALRERTHTSTHLRLLDSERKRLALVFDFSEQVCRLAVFDEVVTRFLRDVTRILGAREGTFFALDSRRNDLYIRCHHGSRPEVVEGFRLAIGEGIAGAVAADLRPRIVNDVEHCPDYVPKTNPIKNIIAAPVVVHEQLIGVVNVNDRIEGPFSNRDLQLLMSLARLGGVALDNARLYEEVRELLMATIESLTTAIDAKDRFALGHSRRVAFLALEMAGRLDVDERERDMLRIAALLHDIGNLAISELVLKKTGRLTEEERATIKEHPALGASILSPVKQLSEVLPGILDHHERYDGRGYPRHLKADEISLQGRVIAIVDAFDAMTHDRAFRKAASPADALSEITAEAGGQFDPALVPIFVECFRSLELDRREVDQLLPPLHPELDF